MILCILYAVDLNKISVNNLWKTYFRNSDILIKYLIFKIIIYAKVVILTMVMWITWWVSFDPQKMAILTTSSSLYIYFIIII